jgi:hypothetical protein
MRPPHLSRASSIVTHLPTRPLLHHRNAVSARKFLVETRILRRAHMEIVYFIGAFIVLIAMIYGTFELPLPGQIQE